MERRGFFSAATAFVASLFGLRAAKAEGESMCIGYVKVERRDDLDGIEDIDAQEPTYHFTFSQWEEHGDGLPDTMGALYLDGDQVTYKQVRPFAVAADGADQMLRESRARRADRERRLLLTGEPWHMSTDDIRKLSDKQVSEIYGAQS